MHILLLHSHYQHRGGEDSVFETEARLLEQTGHRVTRFTIHNRKANEMSPLALAAASHWNHDIYRQLRRLIRDLKPDIAHFHNTFPIMSPSALYAPAHEGVPIVKTLHNYRLLCPAATFFRSGAVCEDCLTHSTPWPAVRHACYRDNRPASAATASMLTLHRALGTWRLVTAFIALSEFGRRKFAAHGIPEQRIHVKGNVVFPDPGASSTQGDYGLFVGRLSKEKGIATLCSALRKLAGTPGFKFKIAGTGPLAPIVQSLRTEAPEVSWLGECSGAQVVDLIGEAQYLVVPSLWYEGFPRVVVEAFSRGTPVVASDIGSLPEMIQPRLSGFLVPPGNADALADQMRALSCQPRPAAEALRKHARARYENEFSINRNVQQLETIYESAITALQKP